MTRYKVYLEVGPTGECVAHVLELLGCFVRARNREIALEMLPEATRAYYTWLREHGESCPDLVEPVSFQVAETSMGFGPFRRGDRAALFTPDRVLLTREELEMHLRRAGYSRADLNLVRDLSDEMLDWKANQESMSIREVLRHIGNAEEWYVSRLVEPESIPREWDTDEDMPTFEFLEMERRTAVDRLRRLTDQELARVFYPKRWTNHPEEPWTARKALRRFLEHEREHIAHIREILSAAHGSAGHSAK